MLSAVTVRLRICPLDFAHFMALWLGYMLSAFRLAHFMALWRATCCRLDSPLLEASSSHTSWPIGELHVVGFDLHFRSP